MKNTWAKISGEVFAKEAREFTEKYCKYETIGNADEVLTFLLDKAFTSGTRMRHNEIRNLEWTFEVEPELFGEANGIKRAYQIRKPEYGFYSKKEAQLICGFLRKNFIRILNDYL